MINVIHYSIHPHSDYARDYVRWVVAKLHPLLIPLKMSYSQNPEIYVIDDTKSPTPTAPPPYSPVEPLPHYRDTTYDEHEVIFHFTDASIRQGFVR